MTRTFLLGIDGLPNWQWQELADMGVMPYSAELLKTGTLLPMQSAIPEVSSSAWASIVTGRNPGGHNIFGFTDLIDGSYTLGFTSSRTFKAPPFWQLKNGRTHLIINVPQTYPALPLEGTLVSGYVALDLERAVFPPEKLPFFEEIGYQVDADMTAIEVSKDKFLTNLHEVLKIRLGALEGLWDRESWDTIMFVITGTDRINHYLWEDYEDRSSPYYQKYLDFYREVDRILERIVSRLDDDATLIVISDHGFGRQEKSVNVNYLLHQHGYLALEKSDYPSYIHMQPQTKAFAMDPGRVYLHREGRYPNGRIKNEEAAEVETELAQLFLNAEVDGKKLVERVLRGRDIYSGPFTHRAPDLILLAADGMALSGRMNVDELIEPTRINGKHTLENATFFYRGASQVEIPRPMKVEHVMQVMNQANAVAFAA